MRRRQLVAIRAISLNDAPQVAQAANGSSITAGEKLEEAPLLLIVHYLSDNLPQPLHNLQLQQSGK